MCALPRRAACCTVDSAENRTSKANELANVTTNYGYDSIYELLQATQGSTTTESYTYDPVGNRLSSLGVSSYTVNSSNELTATSNASYTYDSNGNTASKTTSGNTTNYTWDYENRLTSVTLPNSGGTVTFRYDPFGRRIEKISPTTTSIFVYDGDALTETVNASGSTVARYTQGGNIDEPLAMQRGSTTDFYETDGLGSITSLTAPNGTLAQTYSYDSFGNTTNSSGSLTNFFRYTAREFDSETNLYYYRARYYDPNGGRFLSEDLFRFKVGVNFYTYALNSPVNYIDPNGFDQGNKWFDWWGWDWVPFVLPIKCVTWAYYCNKVETETQKGLEQAGEYSYSNNELASGRGDEGERRIQYCTLGDDNCKRLIDNCGGPILGLIFHTGAFPNANKPSLKDLHN
jgi:RHS repeat-associated protein